MTARYCLAACALFAAGYGHAADWPQFRGSNASGVSEATRLPVEFGPEKNVVWKTVLPSGHSSPVIFGDRIFLTGAEGGKRAEAGRQKIVDEGGALYTICLDRRTGKILWKREVTRPRLERYQPTNSPASPSPVTDGKSVYVFFGDFGLVAYTIDGTERWQRAAGAVQQREWPWLVADPGGQSAHPALRPGHEFVPSGRRQEHRPHGVEGGAAGIHPQLFHAFDPAPEERSGGSDRARRVSAHLVQRGDGREAVVDPRPLLAAEILPDHRRRHDLRPLVGGRRRIGDRPPKRRPSPICWQNTTRTTTAASRSTK